MQLVSSSCGCTSEQHAGIFSPCERGSHGAGVTNLRHVSRGELVAQVDCWIALAPTIGDMMARLEYANQHGLTGAELLACAERRAGIQP